MNTNKMFEDLLQQFIEQQTLELSVQKENLTDGNGRDLDQEINVISNPIQHKGKGRPSNKRYLSAIENHSSKHSKLNNQNESSERLKKKNKWQCDTCKFWYHDLQNCPSKNQVCINKENI